MCAKGIELPSATVSLESQHDAVCHTKTHTYIQSRTDLSLLLFANL